MVYVGIDIAKDKHDCFILNFDGEVLFDVFTVKVGLEVTGHYSCSILGFLQNKGLETIIINPLYTSLSRKSISLRKTKQIR